MTAESLATPHVCTECGADTSPPEGALYAGYTVRAAVWNVAYPSYAKGVGVGLTRPCLSCLEKRIGRRLAEDDFILLPCDWPNRSAS